MHQRVWKTYLFEMALWPQHVVFTASFFTKCFKLNLHTVQTSGLVVHRWMYFNSNFRAQCTHNNKINLNLCSIDPKKLYTTKISRSPLTPKYFHAHNTTRQRLILKFFFFRNFSSQVGGKWTNSRNELICHDRTMAARLSYKYVCLQSTIPQHEWRKKKKTKKKITTIQSQVGLQNTYEQSVRRYQHDITVSYEKKKKKIVQLRDNNVIYSFETSASHSGVFRITSLGAAFAGQCADNTKSRKHYREKWNIISDRSCDKRYA